MTRSGDDGRAQAGGLVPLPTSKRGTCRGHRIPYPERGQSLLVSPPTFSFSMSSAVPCPYSVSQSSPSSACLPSSPSVASSSPSRLPFLEISSPVSRNTSRPTYFSKYFSQMYYPSLQRSCPSSSFENLSNTAGQIEPAGEYPPHWRSRFKRSPQNNQRTSTKGQNHRGMLSFALCMKISRWDIC